LVYLVPDILDCPFKLCLKAVYPVLYPLDDLCVL